MFFWHHLSVNQCNVNIEALGKCPHNDHTMTESRCPHHPEAVQISDQVHSINLFLSLPAVNAAPQLLELPRVRQQRRVSPRRLRAVQFVQEAPERIIPRL